MSGTEFFPIPRDPDGPLVEEFIGVDQSWVLSQVGSVTTAAAIGVDMQKDTMQPVVLIEVDGRVNRTDEPAKVRLALSPEAATVLRDDLIRSVAFFDQIDGGPDALRGPLPRRETS